MCEVDRSILVANRALNLIRLSSARVPHKSIHCSHRSTLVPIVFLVLLLVGLPFCFLLFYSISASLFLLLLDVHGLTNVVKSYFLCGTLLHPFKGNNTQPKFRVISIIWKFMKLFKAFWLISFNWIMFRIWCFWNWFGLNM